MATFLFNGDTAAALGIEGFTRTRRSLGADSLTLNFAVDASMPLGWVHGSAITVTKDDAVWFRGTVISPVKTMAGRIEGAQLTAMGAWWKLERTPYVLTYPYAAAPTAENTGGRVSLFVTPETDLEETTKTTLQRILNAATTRALLSGSVPFLFPDLLAPPEKATDRSLAQVLIAVMRYHPDWATYFTGDNVIKFAQRGAQGHTMSFEIGHSTVTEAKPVIREDLVPSGVILRYEREGNAQSASGYRELVGIDIYPTGALPSQTNVLLETITLKRGEPVPSGGLAQVFYNFLSVYPIVEGSMILIDEACDTGIYPGVSVNLIGTRCPTEWGAMMAFVSEISESPYDGLTEVTFGLPPHLGLKDWADLMRFQNKWRTRDELAARDTPVAETPEGSLVPYIVRRDSDGLWVLRVTPGEIGDGNGNHIPKWMETSNQLDAVDLIVPIEYLLVIGALLEVFLYVEFTPEATQFELTDDAGSTFNEYLGTGAGHITDCRIRFANNDARAPAVDPQSGAVTPAKYYWKLATVSWSLSAPAPTLTLIRSGNFQLLHEPPSRLYLIPEQ